MKSDTQVVEGLNGTNLPPHLKVLILYQNLAAGIYAKETFDRFVNGVDFDLECSLDICRFDLLENADMRRSTVQQSAATDVVFVASHSGKDMPFGLRDWLNKWFRGKEQRASALVFLACDAPVTGTETGRGQIDLGPIPPQANVEVFRCVRKPNKTSLDEMLDQLQYRENSSSTVLEQILQRSEPFCRRGISE